MEKSELIKLVDVYKKILDGSFTSKDYGKELLQAHKKQDKSFVETGKEDAGLLEFENELLQLGKYLNK